MTRKVNENRPIFDPMDVRNKPLTIKLSTTDINELDVKSLLYTKGNRSQYIRVALANYKPKKGDF